jgi:hypothetical protein
MQQPKPTPRGGRLRNLLLCAAIACVSLVGTAEIVFRIAGAFVSGRAQPSGDDGRYRIAVLGDSHAYGSMVEEGEAFPAHLQAALEQARPGVFSVFNLGVPGTNTAQTLTRLPTLVETYGPDMVVLWCGVNNAWNRSGALTATDGVRNFADRALSRSKLYRFVRVYLHHRHLDSTVSVEAKGLGRRQPQVFDFNEKVWTINHPTFREEVRGTGRNLRTIEEMEEQTYRDIVAMHEWLAALGIDLTLITYYSPESAFGAANEGMRRASEKTLSPIVWWPDLPAFDEKNRFEWLSGAHPNGPLYEVIAARAANTILARHVDAN